MHLPRIGDKRTEKTARLRDYLSGFELYSIKDNIQSMRHLLLLILILTPLPAKAEMWKVFHRESSKESNGWAGYSREIDLQSTIQRGDDYYVRVRYWSNHPESDTTTDNQSIFTTRVNCKTQVIEIVGHNRGLKGPFPLYKRLPNGDWRVERGTLRPSLDGMEYDSLLNEVCG